MKKLFLFILMSFIFAFAVSANASGNQVYVSGANLGIKLKTDVEVLGTFGIETHDRIETPWKDLIMEHDKIKSVNETSITGANQFINLIEKSNGKNLNLEIERYGKSVNVDVSPVKNKLSKYSLGLYIKDYEMGVGTLSFVEAKTMKYASLGHKMIDKEIYGGEVYRAKVKEIIYPRDNLAGAKKADFVGNPVGNVNLNQDNGVYGVLTDNNILKSSTLMSIARQNEVKKGAASIYTCLEDMKVESYDIEITETKTQTNNEIKGLKFKVTDEMLLNRSGGIIQGMSGSPIIQNGKLIGVVTHVVLKDASFGYACYAEFMYNSMGFSLNN